MNYVRRKIRELLDWMGEQLEIDWDDQWNR
jgi:hypothetical protein